MYNDTLSQTWDLEALEREKDQAVKFVKDYLQEVDAASRKLKDMEFGVGGSKNLMEVEQLMKKASKATDDHAKSVNTLSKAQQRLNILEGEHGKAIAEVNAKITQHNREMRLAIEVENALAGSIDAARAKVKELTAARNAMNATTVEGKARIKELNDEIKKNTDFIEENSDHLAKRKINVGNYASHWDGLGNSIRQVGRELPSLSNGLNVFFSAIANNLPQVADELKVARERNDALKASGEKFTPVWKQVALSIVSWQTAMVVALTLLTTYGKEIKNAIFGTGELDKATKKYNDTLERINENARSSVAEEIAHIRVLESLATTTENTTKAKEAQKRAVDELQRLYPQTLKDYDDEAIKAGLAKDAINGLTQALISKSMAQAAEKKFAAAGEKVYDLMIAQANAERQLAQGQQEMAKANMETNKEDRGLAQFFSQAKVSEAKKLKADITAQLGLAKEEQKKFLNDSMRFAKEAGEAFIDEKNDPKSKSKTYDPTNDQIRAEERLNKARAELRKVNLEKDINAQEQIFNNEKALLSDRLAAHSKYTNDKLALLKIDYQTEVENIQLQLDKIAEIERKSANTRTSQEKKLLGDKETLEAEKLAIVAKYQIKQDGIISEAGKASLNIMRGSYNEQDKEIEKHLADQLGLIDANKNKLIAAEQDKLAKGEITEKQYRQRIADIQKKSLEDSAKKEIEYTKQLIALKKSRGEDVGALEKALATFELQFQESTNSKKIEAARRFMDQLKKLPQLYIQAVNAQYQNEQTQIDDTIAKINEKRDADIDAVNATTASQEEKDKKIRAINIQADNEEKRAANQKKQIQKDQARFNKFVSAAQIAISTAQAIMKNTAELGFVPAIPVNAATAFLGAAQLGIILGTKIPEYWKETPPEGHPYDGPAQVGEVPEVIFEKNKKPELVNTTQVRQLSKGAHVLHLDKVINAMALMGTPIRDNSNGETRISFSREVERIMANTEIVNAIANQTNVLGTILRDANRKSSSPRFPKLSSDFIQHINNKL